MSSLVALTLGMGLKPNVFRTVARTDVFSRLLASYAGMGRKPHTHGGSHHPNYVGDTKFPTILVSDVRCTYAITMPGPAALLIRAAKHTPSDFALTPVPTLRAGA